MRKRVPAEKCGRLIARDVRKMVQVGDESVTLSDGFVLQLRWAEIRGYCAPAKCIKLVCPVCDRNTDLLWLPPGGSWKCYKCVPVCYPSERRTGSRNGQKHINWHRARLIDQQKVCVELLGLIEWPLKKAMWTWEDVLDAPQRPDAPVIRARRAEALAKRLDALDALRLALISKKLECCEAEIGEIDAIGAATLKATAWAVKRRVPDQRNAGRSGGTRSRPKQSW